MFEVSSTGKVAWTENAWPSERKIESSECKWPEDEKTPALEDMEGVYVLFRGTQPIYVGQGHLATRIHDHCKDWLAPWWDNVSWFGLSHSNDKGCKKIDGKELIEMTEMILIQGGAGLWNGAEPQKHFGRQRFIGDLTVNINNLSQNELWRSPPPVQPF